MLQHACSTLVQFMVIVKHWLIRILCAYVKFDGILESEFEFKFECEAAFSATPSTIINFVDWCEISICLKCFFRLVRVFSCCCCCCARNCMEDEIEIASATEFLHVWFCSLVWNCLRNKKNTAIIYDLHMTFLLFHSWNMFVTVVASSLLSCFFYDWHGHKVYSGTIWD